MAPLGRTLDRLSGAGQMLQLLRTGPKTRAELVEATGHARATVATRLSELTKLGIVAPAPGQTSTGGRPPATYQFCPTSGMILAVDCGAHHLRVALTDLALSLLAERYVELEIAQGPTVVLNRVMALAEEVAVEVKRPLTDLIGVGIGVPGPVEHSTGKPISPPIMPGWDRSDIPGILSKGLGVPTWVDNDVNLMALGEHAYRWKHVDNLLYVKVATGIGLGIILDGQLRRGAKGAAGDLGHVALPGGEGKLCHCGNVGCLEAEASALAIAAELREQGIEVFTSREIVEQAQRGESAVSLKIRDAGRKIGRALASTVSLLNPSVIVVGGALAMTGEQLLAGIRESVYARSLPMATQDLRVVVTETEGRAGILGAAAMVAQEVLAPSTIDSLVESGLPLIESIRTQIATD